LTQGFHQVARTELADRELTLECRAFAARFGVDIAADIQIQRAELQILNLEGLLFTVGHDIGRELHVGIAAG